MAPPTGNLRDASGAGKLKPNSRQPHPGTNNKKGGESASRQSPGREVRGYQDRARDLPALSPVSRAISGDHSPPTVPRNILSTDLLLTPDREPRYEMPAAGLPADGGSAIGAHTAESPGFAIPTLVFLSKTPWRSCALVPLTPDFHEHRRAPVQRAGKCPLVHRAGR